MRGFSALLLLTAGAAAAGISNPVCEIVRPGVYRIRYEAAPGGEAVQIFASSRADRIDTPAPLVTVHQSPVEVSAQDCGARVYFHLRPAAGIPRVVSMRRLPLQGAANFRDLGGYRTTDGHYVRWGLVYRSGNLAHLTENDFEYLDRLGIRMVCDLRGSRERAQMPSHWIGPAAEFLAVPIGREREEKMMRSDVLRRVAYESGHPGEGYRQYALDFAREYGVLFRQLAAGEVPLLEYCGSGKDRSGVFAALLLTALGVPRETVIADYLLTTSYLTEPERISSTSADVQAILGLSEPLDRHTLEALMTTRREKLVSTFDDITRVYGSFEQYVRQGIGISDSELVLLRQRLLEP